MARRIRITAEARNDLRELYDFVAAHDIHAATAALTALRKAFDLIGLFPFSCRKPQGGSDPLIREMVVPFGSSGYVVLFEIDDEHTVTVIAVRHQRESDYH